MKKTYFAPATEELQFETEQMIAATVEGFTNEVSETPVDAGNILEKVNSSVWGDED